MNIMGIGPPEMMIIAVVALLVFGPGKLPEVMGQAGKLVRDFRRMSAELSGEFEKTIAEAKDATSGLQAELGGMTKEVNSITNSVRKDLGVKGSGSANRNKTGGSKSSTASKASSTSKAGSTSKSGTGSTSRAGAKSSSSSTTGAKTSPTTTTTTTTKSTATKKPPTPVASREDPSADMSLFEPPAVERPRRTRKAVPSVITDPTPRSGAEQVLPIVSSDEPGELAAAGAGDDALSRARQRRRNAGYARSST